MVPLFWDNFVALCCEADTTPTAVVLKLGLARSNITTWKKGTVPNAVTLKKIANYFNVSVNYLVGNEGSITISKNDMKGTYNVIGNNSRIVTNVEEQQLTTQEKELLEYFRKLCELDKAKAILYVAELTDK